MKFTRVISIIMVLAVVAAIVYLCGFKIMDRDFWWHITAGRVMVQTHSIIHTDPFAYTRAGLPYESNHEWLAQIILYFTWSLGGSTGIILLRTFLVLALFLILLWIDPKNIWSNAFFAMWGAALAEPGYMDRPQLFSYLIFSIMLFLCFRYLDKRAKKPSAPIRDYYALFAAFIGLQILWVNLHGGAAFLGLFLVGTLFIQELWNYYREPKREYVSAMFFVTLGAGLAMLVSPITYQNFTYLYTLMTDKTITFISEWQPWALKDYVLRYGAFWIPAIVSFIISKRKKLFSVIVFGVLAYLSTSAYRNGMFFVFTVVGITIYQLKYSDWWQKALAWLAERWYVLLPGMAVLLFFTTTGIHAQYESIAQRDNLYGYGVFDLAKGAYNFLEQENVQGNMFNTYGIGGYLIYRGYPDRKVFIDGRNVDYGYNFMLGTDLAQSDSTYWKQLEDTFNVTYAVIDYDAIEVPSVSYVPYSIHLDKNPNWTLVYLDDWVAIYLKEVPQNANLIKQFGYTLVNPEKLEFNRLFDATSTIQNPLLEKELQRVAMTSPQSIKGRVALARLYVLKGELDKAESMAEEASLIQPLRPTPYEVLGSVAAARGNWQEAGTWYDKAVSLAGSFYPDINYSYIADIFQRAGNIDKANYYRARAAETLSAAPTSSIAVSTAAGNQNLDAAALNKLGVDSASKGDFEAARTDFEKAIAIDQNFAEAFNNLGLVLHQQKKFDDAIAAFEHALKIKPDYPDAHYNLAVTFYDDGKYAEALAEAQKADTSTWFDQKLVSDIKSSSSASTAP